MKQKCFLFTFAGFQRFVCIASYRNIIQQQKLNVFSLVFLIGILEKSMSEKEKINASCKFKKMMMKRQTRER